MMRLARKRVAWSRDSRLSSQGGDRIRSSAERYITRFCTSSASPELPLEADVGGDSTARWTTGAVDCAGDGVSLAAATQPRSLPKTKTKPSTELERGFLYKLWRRDTREPIEVTLQKAQLPMTAANLALVLTHVRSARDALRLFLCYLRAHPSFVPDKALLDVLGRFWKHEPDRFPIFTSILIERHSLCFQMTPQKLTSLLCGYGWAGLVDDVLEYLSKCEASYGFKPGFVHYSCALQTCALEGRLDVALQVFEQMKENGKSPSFDTFRSLIAGLLNTNQYVEAGVLFEQMFASKLVKPSEYPCRVVSYVTIVDGMLNSQKMKEASEFLLRMNDMGFVPDYFTCVKVLNAYTTRGLVREQREFFIDLNAKGMIPDVSHIQKFIKDQHGGSLTLETQNLLNSLLASLVTSTPEDATRIESSEKTASEMEDTTGRQAAEAKQGSSNKDNVPPSDEEMKNKDLLMVDRIIYGLCVQEKSEDAFELLMRSVDLADGTILPSATTIAILFDGLCWDLAWEAAEQCLRLMMGWGHTPDVKVYNTWVVRSAKANLLENVQNFLNDFSDRNLTLDFTTYNVLLEKFCMGGKLDEAMKLTQEVNEYSKIPDVVSYSRMIRSFAKAGNFDISRKLLAEMVNKKVTPYALPFAPLVKQLCLSGKIDEALDFVEEIEARGCAPLSSLYTIIIKALCKASRLQDAFKVVEIMEAKGVSPEIETHKELFGSCMGPLELKPVVQAQ